MLEWIALINHRKPSSLTSLPKPSLSLATRSAGVPLGTSTPRQKWNTMSMPASRQVGTFGRLAQRCVSVTQRPLSPAQNVLADHARIACIGHGVAVEQVGDGRAAAAKLKRPHLRAGFLFHQQ